MSHAPSAKQSIDFLLLLQKLKVTKRTGWVRKEVPAPESIADHMYRMGMMSLVAGDCGVDSNRCIRMALVHDIAESIVGDITPHCNVSKKEKNALETDAMNQITAILGSDTGAAKEVSELWNEYEAGTSPEAQLVKDFDKLEMIIQAHEYEEANAGMKLQEFFDSTDGKFRTQLGIEWAQELIKRRRVQHGLVEEK
ncbi:hypothetical protein CEUSTIGMA_g8290.t1 [Chlamydomonas eustigma]|uniref:5'-deoxynucleotidase n=1 Tax=Chlamydomonas eustigma TaxID=1157962 RepID=A0A250XCN4_9CHLO|nr:hypothetical protein CEUSTIGMA_g8290.t1 [Chlamydomonas eustigma]|eukprot:GAX80855.1 hypothetical protein CEUSTIGMA_g8290.t1 [Chlamydomonas eustigma]